MNDKHLQLEDFSKDNLPYLIEEPDKNFSPERNYSVIRQIIKENDQVQVKMAQKTAENAGNAADILSSFAKYKLDRDGGKQLEQWLGKHWMTRIYGDKLIEKIRTREAIVQMNLKRGNTMLGGNFYLK